MMATRDADGFRYVMPDVPTHFTQDIAGRGQQDHSPDTDYNFASRDD